MLDETSLDDLISWLTRNPGNSDALELRRAAIERLVALGDVAVPALARSLLRGGDEERSGALQALQDTTGDVLDAAAALLHVAAADSILHLRAAALEILADLAERLPAAPAGLRARSKMVLRKSLLLHAPGALSVVSEREPNRAELAYVASLGLQAPDVDVRIQALRALVKAGVHHEPEAIARVLADPEIRLRRELAWHLRELPASDSVTVGLALLADPSPEVRNAAGFELRTPDAAVDPRLIRALPALVASEDRAARFLAIRVAVAARLAPERLTSTLRPLLDDREISVISSAVEALPDDPATVEVAGDRLLELARGRNLPPDDTHPGPYKLPEEAQIKLVALGEAVVPLLLPRLLEEAADFRPNLPLPPACWALSQLGEAAARAVLGALDQVPEGARPMLLELLGRVGQDGYEVDRVYSEVLRSSARAEIEAVLAGLRHIRGSLDVQDALLDFIDAAPDWDEDGGLQIAAARRLRAYGDQAERAVPVLEALATRLPAWQRGDLISVFGGLGPPGLGPLRRRLEGAGHDRQREIASALKHVGAGAGYELSRIAAGAERRDTYLAAIEALRSFGRGGIAPLRSLLARDSWPGHWADGAERKQLALQALEAIGREAVPTLAGLLSDRGLCLLVAETLTRLGPVAAGARAELLGCLAAGGREEARIAVIQALGAIGPIDRPTCEALFVEARGDGPVAGAALECLAGAVDGIPIDLLLELRAYSITVLQAPNFSSRSAASRLVADTARILPLLRLGPRPHGEGELSIQRCDFFVSYASGDWDDYVQPLVLGLEEEGVRVFLDRDVIRTGDPLSAAITGAIEGAHFALVALSLGSVTRTWPRLELNASLGRGVRDGRRFVLPVLLRPEERDALIKELPILDDLRYLAWWELGVAGIVEEARRLLADREVGPGV